mgnify:CR=1 FL=1
MSSPTFWETRDQPVPGSLIYEREALGTRLIALMYKVNFAYKKAYISPAYTSLPQEWNKGTKKDVEPNQIKNLVFRKDKKTQEDSARHLGKNLTLKNQFDPRKLQDRQLTN